MNATIVDVSWSPRTGPAQEGAVGEVIAFGLPALRVRRKSTGEFCEVTILPGRGVEGREGNVPPRPPKRLTRKPGMTPRPTGAGVK